MISEYNSHSETVWQRQRRQ